MVQIVFDDKKSISVPNCNNSMTIREVLEKSGVKIKNFYIELDLNSPIQDTDTIRLSSKPSLMNKLFSSSSSKKNGSRDNYKNSSHPSNLNFTLEINSNDSKIFGKPICNESINFFHETINNIKTFGLQVEGIFRISGSLNLIDTFRNRIDKLEPVEWSIDTIHIATGLLKLYLRSLPEPILNPIELWELAHPRNLKYLQDLLPRNNNEILELLLSLLKDILKYEQDNKMSIQNLATMIGPNLLSSGGIMALVYLLSPFSLESNDLKIHENHQDSHLKIHENHFYDKENEQEHQEKEQEENILGHGFAIFDYKKMEEEELELLRGEIIFITENDDSDGWWEGFKITKENQDTFQKGKFPHNYIKVSFLKSKKSANENENEKEEQDKDDDNIETIKELEKSEKDIDETREISNESKNEAFTTLTNEITLPIENPFKIETITVQGEQERQDENENDYKEENDDQDSNKNEIEIENENEKYKIKENENENEKLMQPSIIEICSNLNQLASIDDGDSLSWVTTSSSSQHMNTPPLEHANSSFLLESDNSIILNLQTIIKSQQLQLMEFEERIKALEDIIFVTEDTREENEEEEEMKDKEEEEGMKYASNTSNLLD